MRKCCLVMFLMLFLGNAALLQAQVNYKVTGVFTCHAHDGKIGSLHCADGRVFAITGMDLIQAGKWDGKAVTIEGSAHQADEVGILHVKKIIAQAPAGTEVVLPSMKVHQKPPTLINRSGSKFQVRDVRWGYTPGQPKTSDNLQFANTTIDASMVDHVYFVLKPFPPEWIAAHSLFLFTFKKGGCLNSTGQETKGMFLSIEAYQNEKQKYSLTEGLKNVFGVSWILCTWEDYTETSCGLEKARLIPYLLKITPQEGSRLLEETISQAVVPRQGEYYNTITNNCTNNLIILLNRILPKERQFKLWAIPSMVYNFKATMPVLVSKLLKKRGFIGEPLPELNNASYQKYLAENL